ncbi:MAG TPA: flavodoxin domain-containing protein, partial [Flavisolibacter sp.]|nr:flavodoxin domain-containing protein [Flavisolibacter sp.]
MADMLTAGKMNALKELVANSTSEELIWISGYLAGLLANSEKGTETAKDAVPGKAVIGKITIAYGTETGNSKKLAGDFAAKAKKAGINVKLVSLEQYKLNDLSKEQYFISVISTQGDGEPPIAAKKFYDGIHNNGFKVNGLKYGVLALGDTSYPLFCKAGEDLDRQLEKLGGERLIDLQKCDIDYEVEAEAWFKTILDQFGSVNKKAEAAIVTAPVKKKSGRKIYTGTITANINLNDRGSKKQTHHIEIAAEDVDYLPGDSLGLLPENPVQIVESILTVTNQDGDRIVLYKKEEITLYNVLKKKLNIIYLVERVINKYSDLTGHEIPATKIGLLDLLKIYPLRSNDDFDKVLDLLEPIAPRLYSISSSPEAHPGEIHLTVARDKFFINDEVKYGVCSDFFCNVPVNTQFEFYIHKNNQFRLPEENKDIIMVGPGTGVAPFRSFVAHRDATGAEGRNWLFFGDQQFTTDFLYQSEWQTWLGTGVLSNLDVAFSRDQEKKIYVQH